MKTSMRITAGAAGLALAAGLGSLGTVPASASVRPAAVNSSSVPTRHTVVVEPGMHDGRMVVYWMDLSSRFQMTCGPSSWVQGMHWSTWNNSRAVGRGTWYVTDLTTQREGRVTVVLSHPVNGVDISGHEHPYFTRLRIEGSKKGDFDLHWSWSAGWWIG
jgi:hypothetical protein